MKTTMKSMIHARMSTHIVDAGRSLVEGDLIKLELFTELTYHVNDGSPIMPAMFIIGYIRVGHVPVDVKKKLHGMVQYAPTLPALEGMPNSTHSDIDIDPLA